MDRTRTESLRDSGTANGREVAIEQLLEAASRGDGARVAALLDRYPDIVNERAVIPGHTGMRTALHHAVAHEPVVRLLLERGADPNIRDEGDNAMPLHFAPEREDLAVIRLLIEHGADPNRIEIERLVAQHPELLRSPKAMITAAEQNRADVVALLLDLGVPIETKNDEHQRPLHAAAWSDAIDVAQLLIDRGAEIDPVETTYNNTPLDFAVYSHHPRRMRLLSRYSRALWNITFVGNVDRVRELLQEEPKRARVISESNETPLMWLPDDEAAAVELVRLYLEYGADASIRDHNGLTAADHASRCGLREAAELLRAREAVAAAAQ